MEKPYFVLLYTGLFSIFINRWLLYSVAGQWSLRPKGH